MSDWYPFAGFCLMVLALFNLPLFWKIWMGLLIAFLVVTVVVVSVYWVVRAGCCIARRVRA